MAFINTPLGKFFDSLTAGFNFLDKLGEGLNDLIVSDIPAHEQHEITIRIRRCKRHCRLQKYNYDMVCNLVKIDFRDESIVFQTEVAKELCFELHIEPVKTN